MVKILEAKMPASIIDPVSSALHLSLTADEKKQNDLLDNRLISSAKSVLLSKIEFEEAGSYQANHLDELKSRYIILKPDKRPNEDKSLKKDSNTSFTPGRVKQENALPSPKKVFFPLSSVRLGWDSGWQVGSGMYNVGNTCYLNSTLQALFHVPAFANWLMSETHHAEKCIQNGGCIICGMRKTLLDTQNSGSPIKPWQVYSKLRYICRHLTPGRQEDAHEFLRYLVESMEKAYLEQFGPSVKQLDQYSKETTPLNQILGGYLRSAVRCLACSHVSITFQHFQDLLVDARKANNLDEALEAFFSRERLEDLGYKCEACNKKVSATKQFFIERAPKVLCIALKRFSLTGGKLSKHVQFKTRILLKKYMTNSIGQGNLVYRLVSVVTHLGPSQNCGHYTAIGLGPGNSFYQFDDSCVRLIPVSNVLGTNAYIMFYELEKTDMTNGNKICRQSSPAKFPVLLKQENESSSEKKVNNFIGPILPDRNKENSPNKPKIISHPSRLNSTVAESQPCSSESTLTKSQSNYRNDNNNSLVSSSPSKMSSKLTLNFSSSHSNENSHTNSNGKMNGNKFLVESGSFNKTISSVLSPNKSNIMRNGSHDAPASESKIGFGESKSVVNEQVKNVNIESSSLNISCEFRLKNKTDDKFSAQVKSTSNNGNHSQYSTHNGNKLESNGFKKLGGLVPYELESGGDQDDEEEEAESFIRDKLSAPKLPSREQLTTRATVPGWKVSTDVPVSLHSPSLNGVVNKVSIKSSDACNEQPTVISNGNSHNTNTNYNGSDSNRRDLVAQLSRFSHRGYGAPVNSWNGTHAQLNRQVYEDKKNVLKRAAEADDEMDRGRQKKMRHNNYNNNKYYNGNGFNQFQEVQNHRNHWSENGKGRRHYHHQKKFRQQPHSRYNSYSRHHGGGQHHNQNYYRRNR